MSYTLCGEASVFSGVDPLAELGRHHGAGARKRGEVIASPAPVTIGGGPRKPAQIMISAASPRGDCIGGCQHEPLPTGTPRSHE